jgi:hypothetical protein
MENKVTGSCHCGLVRFELKDNPKFTVNCHCDDCKKRNGSAFSTYMGVAEEDLLLNEGENYLKKYKVENSGEKYFCSECGSPIFNKNYRIPGLYLLFYGAFSQPSNFTPSFNVFCSTKHDWVNDINNITSFPGSIER